MKSYCHFSYNSSTTNPPPPTPAWIAIHGCQRKGGRCNIFNCAALYCTYVRTRRNTTCHVHVRTVRCGWALSGHWSLPSHRLLLLDPTPAQRCTSTVQRGDAIPITVSCLACHFSFHACKKRGNKFLQVNFSCCKVQRSEPNPTAATVGFNESSHFFFFCLRFFFFFI